MCTVSLSMRWIFKLIIVLYHKLYLFERIRIFFFFSERKKLWRKSRRYTHTHYCFRVCFFFLSFFLFACLINYLYQFNRSLNCFLCQFIYAHIQIHTHVVLVSNRPVSILRGDAERERCKKTTCYNWYRYCCFGVWLFFGGSVFFRWWANKKLYKCNVLARNVYQSLDVQTTEYQTIW